MPVEPQPEPPPPPPPPSEPAPKSPPVQASPAAPPASRGMPAWAWALVIFAVLAVAAVAAVQMNLFQLPAQQAAQAPAPASQAAEKPDPTPAPVQQKEEDHALLRQYADDWYGARLVQEYEFDRYNFWEPENNVDVLVYGSNYEEKFGYLRLVGDGSWYTWFCEHHYQPGYASVTLFAIIEEDTNFTIGIQTSNYGDSDFYWWGLGGPEAELGSIRVDDANIDTVLEPLQPDRDYWLLLANDGSDFLIRLGDAETETVLGETILERDASWDQPEWRYCLNVGSGVVDLHYYGVRSWID